MVTAKRFYCRLDLSNIPIISRNHNGFFLFQNTTPTTLIQFSKKIAIRVYYTINSAFIQTPSWKLDLTFLALHIEVKAKQAKRRKLAISASNIYILLKSDSH